MTYVIKNEVGRPVGATDSLHDAHAYASRRVNRHPAAPAHWGDNGKLYVSNKWTGWEVVEVPDVTIKEYNTHG